MTSLNSRDGVSHGGIAVPAARRGDRVAVASTVAATRSCLLLSQGHPAAALTSGFQWAYQTPAKPRGAGAPTSSQEQK